MRCRAMIAWLGEEHGLAAEDAFILCSLAGMWNVAMCMPLGILHEAAARG